MNLGQKIFLTILAALAWAGTSWAYGEWPNSVTQTASLIAMLVFFVALCYTLFTSEVKRPIEMNYEVKVEKPVKGEIEQPAPERELALERFARFAMLEQGRAYQNALNAQQNTIDSLIEQSRQQQQALFGLAMEVIHTFGKQRLDALNYLLNHPNSEVEWGQNQLPAAIVNGEIVARLEPVEADYVEEVMYQLPSGR